MNSKSTPLLTAHLFVSDKNSWDGFEEMLKELDERGITVRVYKPNDQLVNVNPKNPRVYVSLGENEEMFTTLYELPYYERKRWLHYKSANNIKPDYLFHCWLCYTDPLPENKLIPNSRFTSDTPLISIFTAAYKSKEKIQRAYKSLLNQTYVNWEWVIIDDSGDNDLTYKKDLLSLKDSRVRRYRQDERNGYIGATKRYAAGLCTGEILVEMDHDDELTSDCLEKIVKGFIDHPECGFAYGDCAEPYVGSNESNWYGWDCGFGYDIYYRVWVHKMNRWQNVLRNTAINGTTMRHLVGLPNHPRAWTRDCYHLLGGHREELLVADDYDLLVRSFLCTKYLSELYKYYSERIHARVKELGVHEFVSYNRVWERSEEDDACKTAHIINEDSSKVSMIFPIPFSTSDVRHNKLFETLQKGLETNFKDMEILVVGRIPEGIETFAAKAPMGAIRWWPMEKDDSLETCLKYAKYCSSCKEKIVILPEADNNK
jgi:glycosyltransferase involved in cell wall biosynthesis